MKPILMFHYRGFLIRIVDNEGWSHPYEWTLDPISPEVKRKMAVLKKDWAAHMKRVRWMRPLRPLRPRETDPVMIRYYRKQRLNNRNKRFYDPTSMPTARGSCSALDYAKDEVDSLLGWRSEPRRPYFNR